eukprot:1363244-Amorphochlora_amoeboformis.AAC.1
MSEVRIGYEEASRRVLKLDERVKDGEGVEGYLNETKQVTVRGMISRKRKKAKDLCFYDIYIVGETSG